MTKCTSCGVEIAKTSKSCPKCGAQNEWVHPEIKRFHDNQKTFTKSFTAYHSPYELSIMDDNAGIGPMAFFVLFMLSLITLLLWSVFPDSWFCFLLFAVTAISAVYKFISMIYKLFTGRTVRQIVFNFHKNPPEYETNDEAYWEEVLVFFNFKDKKDGIRENSKEKSYLVM
ncbi:MAG: zinc ribbon domain-containing protein [Nitrospinae bacterium]|nr:zinc ribbon domain-containing protein [Nitrospinota bacterium]